MNQRYVFEHNILQNLYKNDPVKVINKCLTKKEDYVFELLKGVYEKNNEICPYTLLDLNINVVTKNGFEFIEISMPEEGIEPGNCRKIILCYSFYLSLFQYYTLEEAYNPKYGYYNVLAAWIEDAHISFGDVDLKDDIIEKILTTVEM